MSVVNELVTANRADAQRLVGLSECPSSTRDWTAIDIKGTGLIELTTLYCHVMNVEWTDSLLDTFTTLADDGQEGPWVNLVPQPFVAKLATYLAEDLPKIAEKWHESEELEEWDFEDVVERLGGIHDAAKAAVSIRQDLPLYTSL